ncbi:ABC transporter substrate-binding protein [Bacillus sp. IITD106]|nr:ABC transporter substrate-binding protein [Bacillus sp. IITD106]
MRNRIKFSMGWMFLLIVILMVGCSSQNSNTDKSGNTDKNNSSGEKQSEEVKISFWHIHSDGPMKEVMTNLIKEFEEKNPNIKVEELGINFFDYFTKLPTAMAGGSGPDLALNDTSTLPARAQSGAILDISSFIEKDNFNLEDFFPVLVDKMKYENGVYGLPSDTDVRVLYYNKEHFREAGLDPEKPPTNWKELEEYSEKLTVWKSDNMLERIGFSPSIGNLHLHTLSWANGGEFWDEDGNPTFTNPKNVEALEWIKTIHDKYGKKAMAAFKSQADALEFSPFIAEKASMIVDVNNLYQDIKRYNPDLDFGVAAIPFNEKSVTWSAGFDYELTDNKDERKAEAAWELLKYLTSPEVQVRIHEESGSMVSNMQAAMDPKFMEDPIWEVMIEQMDVARFIEFVEELPSWHGTVDAAEEAVINSNVDPIKALEDAQKVAENAVKNH